MRPVSFDDDFSLQNLVTAFNKLSPEEAKDVLEAIICGMTNRPLGKKVEFTTPMVYVLSVILAGFKPAGWHWSM